MRGDRGPRVRVHPGGGGEHVRLGGRLQAALRHEVEVALFGVGTDEEVDVGGRAVGERVGRLDREYQAERAEAGQRVRGGARAQVEAGQRGQDRQEAFVRDRGERLGGRFDAQRGGRRGGDRSRLFRGEGAGAAAALH